eukprot:gene21756-26170_t
MRSLMFYKHVLPVVAGYLRTMLYDTLEKPQRVLCFTIPAQVVTEEEAVEAWARRHEWGAKKVQDMLVQLSGFYVKVGQVFAAKADLLPVEYIRVLHSLLDSCPPEPFSAIARTVERELGAPLKDLFATFEETALATATIAQVHQARTLAGELVVVKVQRPNMQRLMTGDMTNMLLVSSWLERRGLDLKFDHVACLREYREQVPLEFDFTREVKMLSNITRSLEQVMVMECLHGASVKK